MVWDAILQPPSVHAETDPYCFSQSFQAPITANGETIGTARNFRWQLSMAGSLFLATLETIDEAWARVVGNPDDPKSAYAGPFMILRGFGSLFDSRSSDQ